MDRAEQQRGGPRFTRATMNRQEARMSQRREVVIGHTVLGRPIRSRPLHSGDYAKPRPAALLFGAIHGDEAVTQLMLERLLTSSSSGRPGATRGSCRA